MKAESGEKEWFKDIFDKNYEYIRNYLIYLSGDVSISEDLTQEVFLQLWETRSKVRDKTIRSYLFTIARNSFLKSRRRRKYDIKFRSTFYEKIDNKSPEFLMELKEFDQKLQKIISCLPNKCRAVFLMNRIDGINHTIYLCKRKLLSSQVLPRVSAKLWLRNMLMKDGVWCLLPVVKSVSLS